MANDETTTTDVVDVDEETTERAESPAPSRRPAMVEPPKPRLATAQDLATKGHVFEHEIPGGMIVRMRALSLMHMVEAGVLPTELLAMVIDSVDRYGGKMPEIRDMEPADKGNWLRVVRHAAVCAAVEPRIVATEQEAQEDPSAVWIGAVDDDVVFDIGGRALAEKRKATVPFGPSSTPTMQ